MVQISYTMSTRGLPDMYTLSPRASGVHIRQTTLVHGITITCIYTYVPITQLGHPGKVSAGVNNLNITIYLMKGVHKIQKYYCVCILNHAKIHGKFTYRFYEGLYGTICINF